jgi:hypothetical protein
MTDDMGRGAAGVADGFGEATFDRATGEEHAFSRRAPGLTLREALSERTTRFPHVHVVRDYAVLRQIGGIRYRQYVQNQGKTYATMVLEPHCLIEPCDFHAVNIYARDSRGITCALRIGEASDGAGPYGPLIASIARQFEVPLELALTCTRLVRAPRHSGRHVVDLINFVRWQTVRAGWRYCIMQTAEKLVPFFRKFEFRETGLWSDDATAGRLQALILDTRHLPAQNKQETSR